MMPRTFVRAQLCEKATSAQSLVAVPLRGPCTVDLPQTLNSLLDYLLPAFTSPGQIYLMLEFDVPTCSTSPGQICLMYRLAVQSLVDLVEI